MQTSGKPTSLWDDAQADRIADALARPAPRPKRYTDWTDTPSKFRDGGYLARVIRQTCVSCGVTVEFLEGLFHVELAVNGTRRMTALAPNAHWPLQQWPMEVTNLRIPMCPACLRLVGFDTETTPPEQFSLFIKD